MTNFHEDYARYHTPQGSSDRSFGILSSIVLLFVGLKPLWAHQPLRVWCVGSSGICLVTALVWPSVFQKANRLWIQLGMLLSRLVNPLIMGLLFILVVVPTGLLLRLLGKDLLRLRFDSSLQSYWIERNPPGPDPESMSNQF